MNLGSVSQQITTFVAQAAQHAWALTLNFLVLLALTIGMIIFSYRSRGGIISLVIALYVGYALYIVFPYTTTALSFGGTILIKALISIILFIIATIIPYIFIERLTHGGFGVLSFVPRFVLSFLAAAFLIAIAYHVFDVNHLYTFPKPLDQLFAPDEYFFWWYIAPLVGLFLLVH
jgi:hypothetical protein